MAPKRVLEDDVQASDDEEVTEHASRSAAQHVPAPAAPDRIDPTSQSALLQLQIQGLLDESTLDQEGLLSSTETALQRLRTTFQKLKSRRLSAADHPAVCQLGVPEDFHMPFHAPTECAITGPLLFGAVLPADPCIDVTVRIPSLCLLDKDHRDHRYHAKRLLFLLHLASALCKQQPATYDAIRLDAALGDPRRPTLLVTHVRTGVQLRIHPTVAPGFFALSKLGPERNCLRSARLASAAAGAEGALAATPVYNAGIVADMMRAAHLVRVAAALAPARVRMVAVLMRLWAGAQVPACSCSAAVLDTLWACLAHCVETDRVTLQMTKLQSFRAVMTALGDSAAWAKGQALSFVPLEGDALPPPVGTAAHLRTTPCAMLDGTGWLNLLAGVPGPLWAHVQACARRTLIALSGAAAESGAACLPLFTRPARLTFDAEVTLHLGPTQAAVGLQDDLPAVQGCALKAERLLTRALTTRALSVLVLVPPPAPVALSAVELPGLSALPWLRIALLLDPKEAFRVLDRGPPADSGAPAKAFRALWGDRSDMRRFPDGGICEAVAWDSTPLADRALIPDHIATHILEAHLPGCRVGGGSALLNPVLEQRGTDRSMSAAAPRALDAALHTLAKQLRTLDGVTLRVVATQLLGQPARHTCAFPPLPHPLAGLPASAPSARALPRCLTPVEMLVQVEGSGKWPEGDEAFGKMKGALGCELAGALATSFQLEARACEAHVDVFVEGFAIRLILWSERDEALATRTARGLELKGAARDVMVSQAGLAGARLLARSQHHGLIAGMNGEHPSAEGAARLALRWTAAQLLSYHMPVEVVELLVAHVYTGKSAQPVPASSQLGFLRFLQLLASHPWALQPLVVDPATAMTDGDVHGAYATYRARKAEGPVPACYLVTPYDRKSAVWSGESPAPEILIRAAQLAGTSLAALTGALGSQSFVSKKAWEAAFVCDLNAFDAFVLLRHDANPTAHQALKPSALDAWLEHERVAWNAGTVALGTALLASKNARSILSAIPKKVVSGTSAKVLRKELLVGLDPLKNFVDVLTGSLGHVAVFCCDALGGDTIGIKWRPQAFLPAAFSADVAHVAMPLAASGQPSVCVPDILAILSEVHALGEGLMQDIILCC